MGARLCLVIALLAVAAPSGAASGPSAHAATCRGLLVTMEGQANSTIIGTPGDDVIWAPFGSYGSVDAGAGNDTVCVVPGEPDPGYPDPPTYYVRGGDGDDLVDSTLLAPESGVLFVPADPGSDSLYGGPARELSFSSSDDGKPSQIDDAADLFVTGDGDDVVESGRLGSANPDVIDLGPGDDFVVYAGTGAVAGGHLDGGPGYDMLAPSSLDPVDPPDDPLPPGDLVVDAATGTATVAGSPYLAWTAIEAYSFFEVGPSHRLTFRGSTEPEYVAVGQGRQDIRLGGGGDVLQQGYAVLPGGDIRGGAGRDRLALDVRGDVRVDLQSRASSSVGGVRQVLGLSGFEDAHVLGRSVRLRGTAGDNVLTASGRGVVLVVGRGGADRIRAHIFAPRVLLPVNGRTALGGPGDDTIWGSPRADVLRGGGGTDTTYGLGGRDLCVAERRVGCEIP